MIETKTSALIFDNLADYERTKFGSDPTGYEVWEREGKPNLWVRLQNAGEIRLEADVAYGRLRIIRNGVVLGESKQEPVISQDGTIIGIADYYGYSEGRLFVQCAPER